MVKGKAIDIIKKFSDEESESFRDFLESPFFNKKKKITEIYTAIEKNLDILENENTTEEQVFSGLFKENKYSYSFIRNLMSELLSLCELFLVFFNFKKNSYQDFRINRILLNEYNRRFLDAQFKLKLKNIQNGFSERKIDFEYFDNLGKLESESIAFDLYRSSMENVAPKVLKRSEYHLCNILQLIEFDINDLYVNMSAFNLNFDSALMLEFLKNTDLKRLTEIAASSDSPINKELELRLRLIQLSVDKDNIVNYFRLKELIFSRLSEYSNSEKSNLFIKLKNYCAFRIYKGDLKFYDEKYSLSKSEIESVKYNSDGVGPLFANIYLEIIQKAVHNNETEFARKVIDKLTPELEKSKQESMLNLASAFIEFKLKNYEKTLECLTRVNAINIFMKNNSKLLYLKTYYEMNSLESGLSLLDSFIHYINETGELNENRKKTLKKNYSFIKKLYKIKLYPEKHTKHDLEIMKCELSESDFYQNDWFNTKLEELALILK